MPVRTVAGSEAAVAALRRKLVLISVARVNFLVVYFRSEGKFQSSNCLQHAAMMLVYGPDL